MFQQLKNIYHLFQAILANIIYGFPSRHLKVIGVTGTDGKTTTTQLIAHILKSVGKRVSFISTVHASIAGKDYDIGFHVTTPSPFAIQKFLRQSAINGDEYFILETTSHALDQNRVWGVNYEIGVLTNVTHEHLDYHRNYEEYVKVKTKLLKMANKAVVNEDDESYRYIRYQISNIKAYGLRHSGDPEGARQVKDDCRILTRFWTSQNDLTLFNKYNYAAAYTVCKTLGLNDKEILEAMKDFELPKGRLDTVYEGDFSVVIDFAHTPNAFASLLSEMRNQIKKEKGRLIHVFGAAGLRDRTKRLKMGEISGKYSDIVILTEEDYRSEDPQKICSQIIAGLRKSGMEKSGKKHFEVIIDRTSAIKEAIGQARKGDVVVITGKAHEKSLCRGRVEYPWDEYEAVKKALTNVIKP